MSIFIRNATIKDSRFLAQIILLAGRSGREKGFWDYYLDKPEPELFSFIEKLCSLPFISNCHWSNFLIAETDFRPVAALACIPPKLAQTDLFMTAIEHVFLLENWTTPQIEAAKSRAIRFCSSFSDPAPDARIIEWVACLSTHRRQGIVSLLLKQAIHQASASGINIFQVCAATGNKPAEQAYLKIGFKLQEIQTSSQFQAIFNYPGLSRYLMDQSETYYI